MVLSRVPCPQRCLGHLEFYRCAVQVAALLLRCLQHRGTAAALSSLPVQGCHQRSRHFSPVDNEGLGQFLFTSSLLSSLEDDPIVLCPLKGAFDQCCVQWSVHQVDVTPATHCSLLTSIILALQIHNPAPTN